MRMAATAVARRAVKAGGRELAAQGAGEEAARASRVARPSARPWMTVRRAYAHARQPPSSLLVAAAAVAASAGAAAAAASAVVAAASLQVVVVWPPLTTT